MVMLSETMSLVVPALLLTIALLLPQISLNNDDFPTFGLPKIVTTRPSLILMPVLVCLISIWKLCFVSFVAVVSESGCFVSSRSWSEKSNIASTKALIFVTSPNSSLTLFENSPESDRFAALAVFEDTLSMRSATASAWVKSSLSFKYALFVNSPGCACLAPSEKTLSSIISIMAGLP